jgi:hypothetical protein
MLDGSELSSAQNKHYPVRIDGAYGSSSTHKSNMEWSLSSVEHRLRELEVRLGTVNRVLRCSAIG